MTGTRVAGDRPVHVSGFHEGERAVQAQAGLVEEAARLEGMLDPAQLSGGAAMFLALQRFAVLAARDVGRALWATPLIAPPGFLQGQGASLRVLTTPAEGDPLHDLSPGQSAAVIAVDLQRRRRVRVNGWLDAVGPDGLTIEVEEAYGNCPSYVQQRVVGEHGVPAVARSRAALDDETTLTEEAAGIIRRADTLFVATQHPRRGTDVSHKGGNPGFVRLEGAEIVWPDYAGNNMFNTMGNLVADPSAGLLFIDFETGTIAQLSGTAELEWRRPDSAAGDASTGRWVRFHAERGVVRDSPLRAGAGAVMSPHNPPVLD
jgi:hypothetical protein